MIKATIKSFAGSEFKEPKEIFIWMGFQHGDIENLKVSLTFHATAKDAKENKMLKTDKGLLLMAMIAPEFDMLVSDLGTFSDMETLKDNILKKIVKDVSASKPAHIAQIEIV